MFNPFPWLTTILPHTFQNNQQGVPHVCEYTAKTLVKVFTIFKILTESVLIIKHIYIFDRPAKPQSTAKVYAKIYFEHNFGPFYNQG